MNIGGIMFKKLFDKKNKKKVEEKLQEGLDKAKEVKDEIKEEVKEEKNQLKEKVDGIIEEAKEKADQVKEDIKENFEEAKKKIDETKEDKKEDIEILKDETERKVEEAKNSPSEPIIKEKAEPKKKEGLFQRLKRGLTKTRDKVSSSIDNLLKGKAKIDDDLYDELEEILISADIGVETTISIIDELRDYIEENHIREVPAIKEILVRIMKEKLISNNTNNDLNFEDGKPLVILVIGVNGVGKTTTIGKLAYNIKNEGKTVTLAAADTFRAAAIEQLTEWANRAGVDIVSHQEGADPASVVFDAIASHKSNKRDCLIIDTAGRLHNKKNLMNELEKINRIIDNKYPEASRETLLVLDATTGQNAIYQAKEFNKVTNISGLVLTKMDGTAKGGVVFPLQVEHSIPVKYIGIGEGIDNLEKFNPEEFVDAMF